MTRAAPAAALLLLAVSAPLAIAPRPAASASPSVARTADAEADLQRARGDVATTARAYRESLVRLLPFREDAVRRATLQLATRRRLLESGAIARSDVDAAEKALDAANAALVATHQEITDTDRVLAEAVVLERLRPPPTGETTVTTMLVSFHGAAPWSLTRVDLVRRFFVERFGRPLPISALGQTPVHDRLGFDHRNALDVAVHPDSAEGKALMAWLRAQGLSFLAFRGAVSGEATGAHVHIGEPSPRRAG